MTVTGCGARLGFRTLVDVEQTDPLVLEHSTDGGLTWRPVPFTVRLRHGAPTRTDGSWATSRCVAGSGPRPCSPPASRSCAGGSPPTQYLGRGVHVDDVQVRGGARADGERRPELFTASNWVATNH